MFEKKELKNGKAHQIGKQYGAQAMDGRQHKHRKSVTKWTQAQHFQYRGRKQAGPVYHANAEVFQDFPKIWEAYRAKLEQNMVTEVEKTAPPKRMGLETEKAVLREIRVYRKCSRNCKPRAFGGCKGWTRWASCPPPPEPKEE